MKCPLQCLVLPITIDPSTSSLEKVCSRCNTLKSIDLFYASSKSPDGNQYWCKDCKLQHLQQNPLLHSVANPIGSTISGESLFKCNTCSTIKLKTEMTSNLFYCKPCKNARDIEYKSEYKDEINLKRRIEYSENETLRENAKKKSKEYHETRKDEINQRRKQLYALKRMETKEERDNEKNKKKEEVLNRRKEIKNRVCSECKIDQSIDKFAWENKQLFLRRYRCIKCSKKDNIKSNLSSDKEYKEDKESKINQSKDMTKITGSSKGQICTLALSPVKVTELSKEVDDDSLCVGCNRPKLELQFSFKDKANGVYNHLCVDCDSKRQRVLRAKKKGVEYIEIPDGKKKCNRCDTVKDMSEFAWKNKKKGIFEPKCKQCNAIYQKEKRKKIQNSPQSTLLS